MKTYPLTQLWVECSQQQKKSSSRRRKRRSERVEKMSEKIYAMRVGHQVVSQPEGFNSTCQHSHLRRAQKMRKCNKREERTTSRHEGYVWSHAKSVAFL